MWSVVYILNSQQTPHNSPVRASYGVSIVSIVGTKTTNISGALYKVITVKLENI